MYCAPALDRRFAEALAAARPAGEDLLAGPRVLRRRRRSSCAASTCGAVRHVESSLGLPALSTSELRRIERAAARVVDDAVLQPVEAVARLDRRLREQRQLGGGMIGLPSAPCVAIHECRNAERLADAVVRRIAGDDAVVVVRVALRLGHRLVAAGRAADEVRRVGEPALRVADDQLRRVGHHVDRAVGPVDHFLRMALPELHVVAGVAGVGARRRRSRGAGRRPSRRSRSRPSSRRCRRPGTCRSTPRPAGSRPRT